MTKDLTSTSKLATDPIALLKHLLQNDEARGEIYAAIINDGAKGLAQRAVRVLSATSADRYVGKFLAEIIDLHKKGRIRPAYINSENGQSALRDILNFFAEEVPDPIRYKAVKNLFTHAAHLNLNEADQLRAHQILAMVLKLSTGEILLLSKIYRSGRRHQSRMSDWVNEMAQEPAIGFEDLVALNENKLLEKKLIMPPSKTGFGLEDDPSINWGLHNRLTQLGKAVCEYIQDRNKPA